jgi:tRNA dimethylallyltransferase
LKQKAIAVTGPTASGKTALAIALARELDGEIISCDSMQIYRGMDIGTAKASEEERRAVVHHMIDILEPTECFSAADYAVRAEEILKGLAKKRKTPIFCGGTGLYLEAVRTSRHGTPIQSDPAFRAEMNRFAEENGNEALYARLSAIDPEAAGTMHPNNRTRVIRALEIFHATGKTKTEHDRDAASENPSLSLLNLRLTFHSRPLLYERIDRRVDAMMKEGLLEETERLWREGKLLPGTTAAAAIGYKECLGAVKGECSIEEAAALLKNATHHYAKRQETWFSAKPHIPIYADEDGAMRPFPSLLSEALALAEDFLKDKR